MHWVTELVLMKILLLYEKVIPENTHPYWMYIPPI